MNFFSDAVDVHENLHNELKQEVASYRSLAFAESTKKTYKSHLNSYLDFCDKMDILPVPASEETIASYAAFLARRLKPTSVRQYLNIVRVMHLECGESHPYKDSWLVKSTLKGIERAKGCEPNRKTPILPQTLFVIKDKLDFSLANDVIFWAACIVMFFGLLRKSNLFQENGDFDENKQLTIDCFSFENNSINLDIRWSKTIQCKEKVVNIKLPRLSGHPLCPYTAVQTLFDRHRDKSPRAQAFPIKGSYFNRRLRSLTKDCPGDFSSHSFRRGGATWALMSGIPEAVIKLLGDWSSDCYLRYLDQLPSTVLNKYRHKFALNIPPNIE